MRIIKLNELTEFNKDETFIFDGAGIEITFTGASTLTMDNDDVITDADFVIKSGNNETEIRIECMNGKSGKFKVSEFLITLEFADAYNQFCGLKLTKI